MGKSRLILKPTSLLRKKTGQMYKLFNLWEKEKNPAIWHRNFLNQPTAPPQPKEGTPVFLTKTQDVLVNNLKKPLDELGVNVTSIESKAWNKGVNVFYYTQKPFNETTHKMLNSLSGLVAAAITERRLIGRTPPINFVYDEVADLDRTLENSLKLANIDQVKQTTELVEEKQSKNVVVKTRTYENDSELNVRTFSAPPDMINMAQGLDYAGLYNKVAAKLERGRGQSERMLSSTTIASTGPVIKLPIEETTDEDPVDRIKAMQRFIIDQRKKKEHLSRVRRKQELLHRDSIKWDLPEDDSEGRTVDDFVP